MDEAALLALLASLSELGYRFTAVTPRTHALVNARDPHARAQSLGDVLGWNQPFAPQILPTKLFDAMQRAGACSPEADGLWRATLRVASCGHLLFAHSAFPTDEQDAVFFGPDSYRFARVVRQLGASATRAVDIGCGSGVGGVVLSHFSGLTQPVLLTDINERALRYARVNARAAGVAAEVVKSDVLASVEGPVDLIIANPPYLLDDAKRAYRHGGDAYGSRLSTRIVRESLERLDRDGGGTLLVYTGVAMLRDGNPFLDSIRGDLAQSGARFQYEELDPDVFGEELERPAYREVERIAVVMLQAVLGARG